MNEKPVALYPVPHYFASRACECGAALVFGVNPATGKRIPLSVGSEHAVRDAGGRVVSAPSHFTDCPLASKFSRRSRAK